MQPVYIPVFPYFPYTLFIIRNVFWGSRLNIFSKKEKKRKYYKSSPNTEGIEQEEYNKLKERTSYAPKIFSLHAFYSISSEKNGRKERVLSYITFVAENIPFNNSLSTRVFRKILIKPLISYKVLIKTEPNYVLQKNRCIPVYISRISR